LSSGAKRVIGNIQTVLFAEACCYLHIPKSLVEADLESRKRPTLGWYPQTQWPLSSVWNWERWDCH
jgi:hypothetical protein